MPTLGLCGVFAAVEIRSDDDRRPAGRERNRDIIALVGCSLSASGSGFVPGTPLGREAGTQPIGTSVGVLHPLQKAFTGTTLQQITGRNPLDEMRHRQGRGVSRRSAESTKPRSGS